MRKLRPSIPFLPVAMVVLVVLAAVPAGVGAGALETTPSSASPAASSATVAPTFASSAISEERGDVVRIPVRMAEGASAEVRIIGRQTDYEVTLQLSDDDNDGLVAVEFNTFLAGGDGAFEAESAIDTVRVYGQAEVDGALRTGGYRLLTDGDEERADLTIEPRSTRDVDAMVAPVAASEQLTSVAAVTRYRQAGNLTLRPADTPEVAARDTLVVRFRASGLSGALASQPGDTVTERFRSLVDSDLLSLSVVQTNAGTDRAPARLLVDRSGVHVVARQQSDAYFLVVDTAEAHYRRGDDGAVETGLPDGARFGANLTVEPGTRLSADRESVTGSFLVVDRTATIRTHSEAGAYYVNPARGQWVNGTTTLSPGSTVEVRVRTADGGYDATRTATVRASDGQGTFATRFGLQSLAENTTLEVTARDDGAALTADPATVTVRSPAATLREPTLTAEGGRLRVTLTSNLTRGGVLTVRADNASGRLVGTLAVAPGTNRVSVPLFDLPPTNTPLVVTAVRDLDGDGEYTPGVDVPYEEETSPRPIELTIVLYRTPPSPTASPTATTAPPTGDVTPTNGGTTTPGGSPATPTEGTPTDTPGTPSPGDPLPVDVPGFGIPVALAAAALALVLLRRDGR